MTTASWMFPIDSGWSDDAWSIRDALVRPDRSVTVDPSERLALLDEVWQETREPGWNGYGARPVEPETVWWTATLLETLPMTWDDPEISADPDGHLNLQWSSAAGRIFSISIDRNGAAHYAGIFGRSRESGTEPTLDRVPEVIGRNLARLFPAPLSQAS